MKRSLGVIISLLFLFSVASPMFAVNAAEEDSEKNVKTSIGLTEYVVNAYEARWGYVYGTFGQVLTEKFLEQKAAFYPDFFYKLNMDGISLLEVSRKWMDSRVVDCIGLIKSYLWTDEFGQDPVHYNAGQDKSADQAFESATESGDIESIPNIHGLLLYAPGHVGVYIGNDEFIHAGSTEMGVTKGKLSGSSFTKWYKCPWVEYPTDGEYTIAGQTFVYQNGEYITGWSNGKYYGTDGIKTDAPNGNEIVINRSNVTMRMGTSMQLSATSKENLKFTWASSNSDIVAVDKDGNVSAVSPGKAYIYVRDEEGNIARCEITVEELYKIYSISTETDGVYKDASVTVTVETDVFTDILMLKSANKDVEYSCPGFVETNGVRTWKLTFLAKNAGMIPYVVVAGSNSSQVWGKSSGFNLHVGTPLIFAGFRSEIPSSVTGGDNVVFELNTNGGAGSVKYVWNVYKDNVLYETVETETKKLIYKTSESGVYMVRVSAIDATGRCVTATSKQFKVNGLEMTINRDKVIMNVGQNVTLTGQQSALSGEQRWQSSSKNTVEVENGVLTAKKVGTATITLSSTNKKIVSAQCDVTVVEEDLTELEKFSQMVDALPADLATADSGTISNLLSKFSSLNENLRGIYLNDKNVQKLIDAECELYRRTQQYDLMNGMLRFFGENVIASPGIKVSELRTKLVSDKGTFVVVDSYGIPVDQNSYLSNSMRIIKIAESVVNFENLEICSYTVIVRGDINGDGVVDISDYYILNEKLGGRQVLDKWQMCAADITATGTTEIENTVVDNEDLQLLADWLLGKAELEF